MQCVHAIKAMLQSWLESLETKQCYFNYVFHYCPLLNRKYHAVIEQEKNISGVRQYFLKVTGWNCKGIEIL